jgi:hypothetical protein
MDKPIDKTKDKSASRRISMRPIVAALVVAVISAAPAAKAQNAAKPAEPTAPTAPTAPAALAPAAAAAAPEPYQPGLGEIMALQQMRHIKLWFAGRSGNWPLADYEIGELKEGFEDVSGLLGSDIVNEHVGTPIAALEKAIDGKNKAGFTAAFDKLSASCNVCHHALGHGFIAIQRPAALPYSDQAFAPQ